MQQEYLLDTNAYFHLLKAVQEEPRPFETEIKTIQSGKVWISSITRVEIISVLGKYARGVNGGFQKCGCIIDPSGQVCQNNRYTAPRRKWTTRMVKGWLQLVADTLSGQSQLVQLNILPFDQNTIQRAEQIIQLALIHNFASMDAMIAATAKEVLDQQRSMTVVTSDKGLKACLDKSAIPYWDAFQVKPGT